VQVTRVQEVSDPVQAAQPAQQGTIIAVQGQLAKPAQDAAPKKVVEAKHGALADPHWVEMTRGYVEAATKAEISLTTTATRLA